MPQNKKSSVDQIVSFWFGLHGQCSPLLLNWDTTNVVSSEVMQTQCVCVCLCVCMCLWVGVLYLYIREDYFKHRSYRVRTFLEREDILTGPHLSKGLF